MKRVGNLMKQIAGIDNLYLAWLKARKGKQHKVDVIEFGKNVDCNLFNLQSQLLSRRITVGDYHYFMIYDPKERQICAASFYERVLHHAIMNVCGPIFEQHLIFDTYATRKEKGTYAALDKARCFVKKYDWFVKMDVRKYFDSIDQKVLMGQLTRKFKDDALIWIFDELLASYSITKGKGLPIGNLTSQYFANHYLSSADHYAKEQLKVPGYIRYMDDILIFGNDKLDLLEKANRFVEYVKVNLFLELKQLVHAKTDYGVSFLGYKLFPYYVKLNKRSKLRFKKKARLYGQYLKQGKWNENEFQEHILPLIAFVDYADTLKLKRKVFWDENRRL